LSNSTASNPASAQSSIHEPTRSAIASRFWAVDVSSTASSGHAGSNTTSPAASRKSSPAGHSANSPGCVWNAFT
jgi:hypothetical protein